MDLHEFQAKELLARFGIDVPSGQVVETASDAERAAERLGSRRFVVKAQIKAGDRAQHGGVRFAAGARRGRRRGRPPCSASGSPPRKPPEAGLPVKWVYVEEAIDAAQALYAAVVLDRTTGRPLLLASAEGGDDIEARAERDPDIIQSIPLTHPRPHRRRRLRRPGGPHRTDRCIAASAAAHLFRQLATAFVDARCQPARDQSAGARRRRPADRARCQARHRRQRPVPPPRPARPARLHGAR